MNIYYELEEFRHICPVYLYDDRLMMLSLKSANNWLRNDDVQ
jgi:hypothetical protein